MQLTLVNLSPLEVPPNPGRPLPTVHHGPDLDSILLNGVVDCEWEPLGKGPVEASVHLPMDATEQLEALDVGVEVDQEIPAQSPLFILIEMEAIDQVVPGEVEDVKPH